MIEGGPTDYDLTSSQLHARAMDYMDKADGRIDLEPGDSDDPSMLFRAASGFEMAAYHLIPEEQIDQRAQTAVLALNLALKGKDYKSVVVFGNEASCDLAGKFPPSILGKIHRLMGQAAVGFAQSLDS